MAERKDDEAKLSKLPSDYAGAPRQATGLGKFSRKDEKSRGKEKAGEKKTRS